MGPPSNSPLFRSQCCQSPLPPHNIRVSTCSTQAPSASPSLGPHVDTHGSHSTGATTYSDGPHRPAWPMPRAHLTCSRSVTSVVRGQGVLIAREREWQKHDARRESRAADACGAVTPPARPARCRTPHRTSIGCVRSSLPPTTVVAACSTVSPPIDTRRWVAS